MSGSGPLWGAWGGARRGTRVGHFTPPRWPSPGQSHLRCVLRQQCWQRVAAGVVASGSVSQQPCWEVAFQTCEADVTMGRGIICLWGGFVINVMAFG